ncbi:hypothetical protein Avbf_04326 [Armadillidium vulgare]|nr:hypothetical protein Avbf_04326 [Armadillidium vulgare]
MDIPGVSIIPGILDLRVDNVKIAIINYTDQEKRIKRNTLVGKIKLAEKLEIVPMIQELTEVEYLNPIDKSLKRITTRCIKLKEKIKSQVVTAARQSVTIDTLTLQEIVGEPNKISRRTV